jgi:hypothetical protein
MIGSGVERVQYSMGVGHPVSAPCASASGGTLEEFLQVREFFDQTGVDLKVVVPLLFELLGISNRSRLTIEQAERTEVFALIVVPTDDSIDGRGGHGVQV